ncbi:MAG: ribonuclease III [Candidatus Limnocylindrales bacterium]
MEAAAALAQRLRLPFRDLDRLEEALVHSSYPNEHPDAPARSNERLEFLGDAIIALVISEALYARHPDDDEGHLTARRAALVSTTALAAFARRIDLSAYLVLGQGATRANERERASVLAAAFEAVAAAIYLELGLPKVRAWLLGVAEPELTAATDAASLMAPKSRLQAIGYARDGHAPLYRVVSAEGPDHAKRYQVEVIVGEAVVGSGEGTSRRAAETRAAEAALARFESDALGLPGEASRA